MLYVKNQLHNNCHADSMWKRGLCCYGMGPTWGSPGSCRSQVGLMNLTIRDIPPKLMLNPNLANSRLPITYFSVDKSCWNYTKRTVSLSCFVKNFKSIRKWNSCNGMVGFLVIELNVGFGWISHIATVPGVTRRAVPSFVFYFRHIWI